MVRDLSLNLLDLARNSLEAGAAHLSLLVRETKAECFLTVTDDGCGMPEEMLTRVTDPFFTTRTARRVGLGIPLLKMAAERTGGEFSVTSRCDMAEGEHGTQVTARFRKDSVDMPPLGDVISTVCTVIQGAEESGTVVIFRHDRPEGTVLLDTGEVREVLGTEVPLSSYTVLQWVKQELTEQYRA